MKKIFTFLLLLMNLAAFSQHWNKIYSYNEYLGLWADSVMHPPADTLASAPNGSLAIKNNHVYQKNSSGVWMQVDGGGNAVQSLTGSQSIQYGSFASMPTPGTPGRYYAATDSSHWYLDNGTAWLNLSGSGGGSIGAILTFGTGLVAGSYNGSVPVTIMVDTNFMSTRAWRQKGFDSIGILLATKMINYGGAPGWKVGTYAALPAANSLPAGTHYTASDSAMIFLDTGSGGTAGWKLIARIPQVFNLYLYQGLKPYHGSGDTAAFGGILSEPDTLDVNGWPFYIKHLPSKASALPTDSFNITDTAGRQWKVPASSSGGGISQVYAKGLNTISGTDTVGTFVINIMDPPFYCIPDCNGTSGSGTDNSTGLQLAVAFANATGATIYIPPVPVGSPYSWKGFRWTIPLVISGKNLELSGHAMGPFLYYQLTDTPSIVSGALFFDNNSGNAITFNKSSSNVYPVYNVHDFTLRNIASSRATAGAGILIDNNNQQSKFNNLSIEKFYTNINQISADLITYDKVNSLFPVQYGFHIGNNESNDFGGSFLFHCNVVADTFATTTAIGIYVTNPAAFEMAYCSISGLVGAPNGQFINGVLSDASDGPTSDFRISHCWFEGLQQTLIKIRNLSSGNIGNIMISDNELYSYNNSGANYPSVDISHAYNVQLHSLILGGQLSTGPALRLDSITNLSIGMPMNVISYPSLALITNSTINQNDFYGASVFHGAVTDSMTLMVNGAAMFNNTAQFNSTVSVQPGVYTLGGAQMKISGMGFQGAAFNNSIITDNANYNTATGGWSRFSTGYTGGVNIYNGQLGFFANNTGSGSFVPNIALKIDFSNGGAVHMGGNINIASSGAYSGASATIDGVKFRVMPYILGGGLTTDSPVVWHASDSTFRAAAPFGGGLPGSNTQIIYNNSGAFGASSNLTFDPSTNKFTVDPGLYTLTDYQARISDLYFQGGAANDMFIFDNAKYITGSGGWNRVNTGYVEGFNYYNGQILFSSNPSTSSGSFSPQFVMKTDPNGFVALGGKNISATLGSIAGATMWVGPDSIMMTKPGNGASSMPIMVWNTATDRVDTVTGGGLVRVVAQDENQRSATNSSSPIEVSDTVILPLAVDSFTVWRVHAYFSMGAGSNSSTNDAVSFNFKARSGSATVIAALVWNSTNLSSSGEGDVTVDIAYNSIDGWLLTSKGQVAAGIGNSLTPVSNYSVQLASGQTPTTIAPTVWWTYQQATASSGTSATFKHMTVEQLHK